MEEYQSHILYKGCSLTIDYMPGVYLCDMIIIANTIINRYYACMSAVNVCSCQSKQIHVCYPIGTHAGLIKMHLQKINVCTCTLLMLQKCIIIMSLKMHKAYLILL